MRWARSYSIVDHQLLHAGHLCRLKHSSLCLYLFLVVVSDRDGRSFYSAQRTCAILRLSPAEYRCARHELIDAGLIAERNSHTFVLNLTESNHE